MKQNYEQYSSDQRDEETLEKEAKVVQHYCDRNRNTFLPLIQNQLLSEQQNYKGYKSNSLIRRIDFDDGRYIQYADNKDSNQFFKHSNRCIIALPGIPGSIKDFAPIEKRLEPNFCRFVHIFMPGFDNVDERRGTYKGNLQDGAKLINDLLDRLGIQKVVVMMHSLGGYFAKYFAYSNPDRIEALIQIASIPLTEWHGWSYLRSVFEESYKLGDNVTFEYTNSDEARKITEQGSKDIKDSLVALSKQQRRQLGPVLHFSTSDIICMRKIIHSFDGGLCEILHKFRQLDSRIPRLIAYSPVDELACKDLYEEEIFNLLFVNNKVNYTLSKQPFQDIQLDQTNFQSNFVFRFDKASHYLHFEKADELSVLIKHFIQCLDYIQTSPLNTQRL